MHRRTTARREKGSFALSADSTGAVLTSIRSSATDSRSFGTINMTPIGQLGPRLSPLFGMAHQTEEGAKHPTVGGPIAMVSVRH